MDPAGSFRVYQPSPPLSRFVEMLWYWEGKPLPETKERILPTGTVELVIRLSEDSVHVYDSETASRSQKYSGTVVTGAHARPFALDKSEQDRLIGVHFKPGGAFPFFGVPAHALLNLHLSLDALWGADAERFRDDLLRAGGVRAKFLTIERWLLHAASDRASAPNPAVAFLLQKLGTRGQPAKLSELAERAGYSQRRLIELFKQEVGLTPKVYGRICRFQRAIQSLERGTPAVDWVEVALDAGYYDQAHFIHDFREFSGFRPTDYLQNRTLHLNHVAI